MTASTAAAAINLNDISALESALHGAPSVMGAAGFAFHALRTALDAVEEAGDTGGFGFSADDFGKRAFDANNAGVKAGVSGTDDPKERARRDQDEQALDSFSDSFEAMFGDPLTMFGVRMSAVEWRNFSNTLKDQNFKDDMIQRYLDQGYSREEAERRYQIMQDAIDVKAADANGEYVDPAKRDNALNNADVVRQDLPSYQQALSRYDNQNNRNVNAAPLANDTIRAEINSTKVSARDDFGGPVASQSNQEVLAEAVAPRQFSFG